MNKNPPKVVDTILDSDFTIDGILIHSITLARMALLETIDSPFISSDKKFTLMNVIPSIYILASDIKTISKYSSTKIDELNADALIWSETNEIQSLDKIISAIVKRFEILNGISPQSSGDEGKKASEV